MSDCKCDSEFNGYCIIKAGSCDYSNDVLHCPHKNEHQRTQARLRTHGSHDLKTINYIDIHLARVLTGGFVEDGTRGR